MHVTSKSRDDKWRGRDRLFLVAAAAAAVGVLAVSAESLWIDEFATLIVADHPRFGDFWTAARTSSQSDGQMPLYIAWMWGWIRLFGNGEWVLRAANVPWFVVGTVALAYWCDRARLAPVRLTAICVLVFPMGWYYLNEARPYLMQFAGAAMFLGAVVTLTLRSRDGARPSVTFGEVSIAVLGALLLAGASLLGVFWLATGVPLLALMAIRSRWSVGRGGLTMLVAGGVTLLALGAYYAGTLSRGARAATIEGSVWMSMGSIGYETLGLLGLGPARLELRESGVAAFQGWLGIVLPAAAILVGVLLIGLRAAMERRDVRVGKLIGVLVLVCVPPVLLLLGVGQAVEFRVLARHVMPITPAILIAVAVALTALNLAGRPGTLCAALFLGIWLASSLSVRFLERHAKDDYRGAARLAAVALDRGDQVWWLALPEGAAYYGLPTEDRAPSSRFSIPVNVTELPTGRGPDVILLSKPDLFDRHRLVTSHVETQMHLACHLAAFRVYVRSDTLPLGQCVTHRLAPGRS